MAFTYDIRAMLRKFGVVTVMDVEAYEAKRFADKTEKNAKGTWDAKTTLGADPVFFLDTLKIANINQEGPTKTITGGQNADTLLKYGKTLTVEMQEALGRYDVLENIYGVNFSKNHQIASFTDRFPKELTLVGTTFVIDQATGAKQPIKIVIPLFLGDGIFNLAQDAEGDATVFDLNGNILKFDGGSLGTDPEHVEGFACETECEWDGNIYKAGADNEFYFMSTDEGFNEIKSKGYREAYEATSNE